MKHFDKHNNDAVKSSALARRKSLF